MPFFQLGFTSLQRIELTPERDAIVARYLLIAVLAATLFSSSLTVGLELAVYAMFLLRPSLRARFRTILREPTSIALAFFVAALLLGALHGLASWPERVTSLAGWRRVLLFFLAAAVFDEERAKRDALSAFLIICALAALASYLTFLTPVSWGKFRSGIVIHNHATQSMTFALAAAIAAIALIWPASVTNTWLPKSRFLMAALVVVFVANIAFVIPGRSGYLALLVFAAAVPLTLSSLSRSWRLAAGAAVVICTGLVIGMSGQARDRILAAVTEMSTVEQSPSLTSMGVRVVFWKNTLAVINENPILGVGTGSFEKAYANQVKNLPGWQSSSTSDPHNQFLKILAEQGILGLTALLLFMGTVLTTKISSPYREIAMSLLLAWTATSLFSSHFSTFTEGRLLFFWLGAMLAPRRFSMNCRLGRCSLRSIKRSRRPASSK
jgi:O-antigen ligase